MLAAVEDQAQGVVPAAPRRQPVGEQQGTGGDGERQLLLDLAGDRELRRLADLDHAAGQVPVLLVGQPADQHPAVAVADQHLGDRPLARQERVEQRPEPLRLVRPAGRRPAGRRRSGPPASPSTVTPRITPSRRSPDQVATRWAGWSSGSTQASTRPWAVQGRDHGGLTSSIGWPSGHSSRATPSPTVVDGTAARSARRVFAVRRVSQCATAPSADHESSATAPSAEPPPPRGRVVLEAVNPIRVPAHILVVPPLEDPADPVVRRVVRPRREPQHDLGVTAGDCCCDVTLPPGAQQDDAVVSSGRGRHAGQASRASGTTPWPAAVRRCRRTPAGPGGRRRPRSSRRGCRRRSRCSRSASVLSTSSHWPAEGRPSR